MAMTHDKLGDLLSQADAAATIARRTAPDVARQVRVEARRRQVRTRMVGGAVSATALVAVLIVLSVHPAHTELARHTPPTRPVETSPHVRDASELAAEIAALRNEAAGHEAVVKAMLTGEQRGRRMAAVPRGVDPLDRILAEQDRGAMALVRQADRQYHELDRKESAAAGYGRVVELFPKTHWAAVARQRLSEIGG
jgi:hypothetical protein